MARDWMIALREARYESLREAAKAAGLRLDTLEIMEAGGVTAPEVARRIGAAYGMSKAQIVEITCQASVERRKREKSKSRTERARERMKEVYGG